MAAPYVPSTDFAPIPLPGLTPRGDIKRAAVAGLNSVASELEQAVFVTASPAVPNRQNQPTAGAKLGGNACPATSTAEGSGAKESLAAGSPPAEAPAKHSRSEQARINGAKSRGPKTPEGKTVSSRNATTHGLTASYCVLIDGEDPAEFEAFVADYHRELRPIGTVQASFVQRAAELAWRLRRMPMLEATVLSRTADHHGQEKWASGWCMQILGDDFRDGVLMRLQRYEVKLERSLSMCLRELRQLQRQPLPPEVEEEAAKAVKASVVEAGEPVASGSNCSEQDATPDAAGASGLNCQKATVSAPAPGSFGQNGHVSTHHRCEAVETRSPTDVNLVQKPAGCLTSG